MMTPQTHVLPDHKDEAELKRLLELEEEFDRQQGCGGAEAHAVDFAGLDDGADGDGGGE
jgi:hypothetical protein